MFGLVARFHLTRPTGGRTRPTIRSRPGPGDTITSTHGGSSTGSHRLQWTTPSRERRASLSVNPYNGIDRAPMIYPGLSRSAGERCLALIFNLFIRQYLTDALQRGKQIQLGYTMDTTDIDSLPVSRTACRCGVPHLPNCFGQDQHNTHALLTPVVWGEPFIDGVRYIKLSSPVPRVT